MSDRTEDEQVTIIKGELLMREDALVQRMNARYKELRKEIDREFAELGRLMGKVGVDIARARRDYGVLEGGLSAYADMSFTHNYLEARRQAEADAEVPASE